MQKTVQALRDVRFDAGGLVTVVVQDGQTGEVLMVAHMNREALERTLTTGRMTYWSRSRQKFWVKGETSGNVQHLKEMRVDCDQDCLLALVDQSGPACHEGYRSCFYRRLEAEAREPITVAEQLKRPSDMYGAT